MPSITFITADGRSRTVEVKTGVSIMEGAVRNNVPGIDAECGGCCSCGTCHVHVDPAWQAVVGPATDIERELVEVSANAAPGSRLSCQVKVAAAFDGLVVHVPATQG